MSFSPQQLDEILSEMLGAAGAAGKILMEGLGKPTRIEYKGAVDLVSKYDREAEDTIRKRLESSFPDINMLAEESTERCDHEAKTKWIVDPLDGTTNYLHGHPMFAVSIGLEDAEDIVNDFEQALEHSKIKG